MNSLVKWSLRLVPVGILAVVLSGCFLFSEPPITYGVNVSWISQDNSTSYVCYGLDVTADFGVNRLLDISVDQADKRGFITGMEARPSKQQPYVAGMPLLVEVVCRDEAGDIIGQSTFKGTLETPNESAHFTIWNYIHPEVDQARCVTPFEASGVQICGDSTGFTF